MRNDASITYAPINTLKRVAEGVWIVDGATIRFGWPWPKFRFSTRMTLVRLASGELFLHSPTQLTGTLQSEIPRLGCVRFIIAPNRVHYSWVPEWRTAFPSADVYLAPRVREQAGHNKLPCLSQSTRATLGTRRSRRFRYPAAT